VLINCFTWALAFKTMLQKQEAKNNVTQYYHREKVVEKKIHFYQQKIPRIGEEEEANG